MKINGVKLFAVIVFAAVILITGCVSDNGSNEDNGGNTDNGSNTDNGGNNENVPQTWLDEHGNEIMKYDYSKADIEAEIKAKWQEYGYSVKPTKYIAISFDDGPCSPSNNGGTAAMLAKLDVLKVKATFFVIGQNVRSNKTVAQAIFNAGHELGNHSDGYGSLGGSSTSDIAANLDAASLAIKGITGKYPCLFRAPNLNHGTNLSKVCEDRGMALIDGNVHNDWDGTGHTPTSIKDSVLANPQDGGIILLHDNNTSKGDTFSALPDIINGLREKGFWIMTVGQLATVKEKPLEAGKRYNSIN
ncbi:polysaccharide deacetylase family protein [Treponema sp. R80B11-R83G3]